ncbi:MAG: MBOAT family protein [Deltaproteobacteria bacterium]|jgi:alginate O-acetyltransferase complex protein AlgI|nr:MBOAT family protein [Deltaproteobacteria bacterium]
MVFTSLSFIFLILPIFLAFDFFANLSNSTRLRNAGLLFISLLFYFWGEAISIVLLVALGFINYLAANFFVNCKKQKLWLTTFIVFNLAVLFQFKYAYWLISLFLPSLTSKSHSIPPGLSFFTFHAISYLIDIYRKQTPPAKKALNFLTYFCMFPHLISGPIVRYAQVKDDLTKRGYDQQLFMFGLYRFLVGLNKKVLIANLITNLADTAFSLSSAGHLNFFDAWIGIAAYTVQIYFDFSGYSDMAIGLAAMAGFRFEENFVRPYSSLNIREFWRRWHISLSLWLRDYLYFPLGGNKGSALSVYRNLIVVFFLCGLWHGANLTFIFWGLWHGLFLILERLLGGRFFEKIPKILARVYTLLVVLIGWVFFRAGTIGEAFIYLKNMFSFKISPLILNYFPSAFIFLFVGIVICLLPDRLFPAPACRQEGNFSSGAFFLQAILTVFSISLLLAGARNPFIYFNF